MSGGSLIALAADEIVMNPNAAPEPPVSTDMPADVYRFMELFSNPGGASLRRNMFQFRRAGEAVSKINNEL